MSISEHHILQQYYQMVNHTNIVSKTDIYGIITFVNQKFIDISGYTEEELLGNPHNMIRDPNVDSSIFKNMWETIQSKQIWQGTIQNLKKDGSLYIVDSSIFPILDDAGEIKEYIAIRHDITEATTLHNKVQSLYTYITDQENYAREKLESGIVNDLSKKECKILYAPSDILSGDFYSLYKREDGSTFIYLMDGQGHGVTPALTVFSISSLMNSFIHKIDTLEQLLEELYPIVKNFLGEIEQLSYTMIMISPDKKSISYASAGMYPFLVKKDDEIIRFKANNTPFMEFSQVPNVKHTSLDSWDSLIAYSDGITEHDTDILKPYTPENIIQEPALLKEVEKICLENKFEDDITVVYLSNEEV